MPIGVFEMYKIVYILFLLYSFVECGKKPSPMIVGGYQAPQEFGLFHVSLQNLTGHHVCGGAVVSVQDLVTAAHCVIDAEPQYIVVVIGTTNLNVRGKRYNVDSISIHDKYNTTIRQNDIAVLRIRGTFDLEYIRILDLSEEKLQEGDPVSLSGYGASEPYGFTKLQLYYLNATVFSQEVCRFAMRYSREVTDRMFCTFTKIGQGTCHGDSGGPLTKDNKLVGVVSWGIPCAVGFPDVHTRISPYVAWIRKQIEKKYKKHQL